MNVKKSLEPIWNHCLQWSKMLNFCSKILNRFLIVLALFIFYSQTTWAEGLQTNFVVAKVNSKVITNLELIDRYRFVLFSSKIQVNLAQERKDLLNQIIDKMVDEELIRQEAEGLKIEVLPNEIEDAVEMMALRQKKNVTQFKLALIEKNLSYQNYLRQVEVELAWSKIISETLRGKVKITEVEINEFFEQQKFNTNIKKFFISEIFIPQSDNAEAISAKLVAELRNGADFRSIVKQFSRDSLTAENDGELGWVSQNDIDPKIFAAISKLKKNEYSDPVLAADGYYIFKVVSTKLEAKIEDRDLNAARSNIFVKKLQNLAKGHLMDLRKKSFVEIERGRLDLMRL